MKFDQSHLISAFVWAQMYGDRMRRHNSAKICGAKVGGAKICGAKVDQYQTFKPPLRGICQLMF